MSTTAAANESERSGSPRPHDQTQYVGLATRAVAFVIDVLLIDIVAVVVAAAVALVSSVFHFPKELQTVLKWIGLGVYVLWLFGYFVAFWSATGQTPGSRVMQIRVVTKAGARVKLQRGVVRVIGLILAALPLFAGYVLIPFDRKRRGFQDRLARTVVIEAPDLSLVQGRLQRQRQAYEAAPGRRTTAIGKASPPAGGGGRS